MADDFKSTKEITLQPNDSAVAYQFEVTISSSATANDGKIGFGRTVSSGVVTAHAEDGTTSADLIDSYSESDNIITVILSYPTAGADTYHLTFVCTLDNASTKELDFNRVVAKDK